jgi:hypothetical protein
MMIKLPKKITIYPQKRNNPDYLLCWIPPGSYAEVARDPEVLEELQNYYPNGIEIELSEDGLEEMGMELDVKPDKLKQAFLELNEQGALPESGMIELEILEEYIAERETGRSLEEITAPMSPDSISFGISQDALVNKMQSGPEMTGGEDPQELFKRISVRQMKSPGDQAGGE